MVEVTQADERAAQTIRRGIGGKYDREHQRNVQAFAAHRTAATAAKDARIAELEAIVERYAQHDGLCGIIGGYVTNCTCGLDAVRKALGEG